MRNSFPFYIFFLVYCLMPFSKIYGQEPKLDSIGQVLEESRRISITKVNTLILMSKELQSIDPEKALIYVQQGLLIAERLQYRKGISDAIYYIASSYLNLENYPKALAYYLRALKLYQSTGQLSGQAVSLQSIGQIYLKFGDYEKALEYQLKAIRVYEQVGDKAGEAASMDNLGTIYMAHQDYTKAIQLFKRALDLSQTLDSPTLRAVSMRNLAEAYLKNKNYIQAADLFQKSIDIFKGIPSQQKNLAKAYYGLGKAQQLRNRDNDALSLFLQARNIQTSIRDREGLSNSYLSIADLYINTQNSNRAIEYLNQSLEIAQGLNHKELLKDLYLKLAQAHEKLGMLPESYSFFKRYKVYSDSLYNEARLTLITEMQMRYELQLKEKENQEQKQKIRLLTQERVKQDATLLNKERNIRLQNSIIFLFVGITILIALLMLVVYQSNIRSSRANKLLQQQKEEIETKSKQLELALLSISDSIRYAETIQKSILPSKQKMDKFLGEYFIISRPKNIVSGDFYWISKIEDKTIVAVVDCTGHGVPGGFTSMIGHTLLNEIINQDKILNPSEVLTLLNQGVINVIEKQMQEIGIGMEVCLVILEPEKDAPDRIKIKYAGAKRPLFSIRNNGLPLNQQSIQEFRGDREPIGFVLNSDRIYTQQEIILEKGSLLYLTTDGFVDQANPKNKRFGTTKFKQFLSQQALQDLNTQKKQLEKVLQDFKQDATQRDDITILGLRI